MKHQIAVGVMTAPKIEAVIHGPHSTPEHPTFLLKNVRIGIGFHWDRLASSWTSSLVSSLYSEGYAFLFHCSFRAFQSGSL